MHRLVARRDVRLSRKEAAYARNALNHRLASSSEGLSLRLEEAGIPMFLRRTGKQGKGKPTIQPDRLPQTAAPNVARRAMPVPMHARARPPVGPGSRAEPPVR
jgi:hypothetical protein